MGVETADKENMARPRVIKIGTTKFKVRYLKDLEDPDAFGLMLKDLHEIHVYSNMPEHAIQTTLFHEILHAIAWVYGFNPPVKNMFDLEEAMVCLFAAPILTVLSENDTLRNYLFGTEYY